MKAEPVILIVTAVNIETAPIQKNLRHVRELKIGKKNAFSGNLYDQPIMLIQSGIGMANAVQAATAVIEQLHVQLIINVGCAGVFSESGLSIGDIGIATKEIDCHAGIESSSLETPLEPLPFPLIQTENQAFWGTYPTSKIYTDQAFNILSHALAPQNIQVKKTPFLSVSTITASETNARRLYAYFHAGMENMEGGGIAHTALHYGIPFIAIRAGSNVVGDRDKARWQLKQAVERSGEALCLLFEMDALSSVK